MILAIDPGSEKTGVAIVRRDESLVCKAILDTKRLAEELTPYFAKYDISVVVMGDGTNSKRLGTIVQDFLKETGQDIEFAFVNEKHSTEEGRVLYWEHEPPKGIKKWIPLSFQYPPRPIDDYVAWIIGNIYLGYVKAEDVGHKMV